ncbi:hypothetical protein [Qipengyuania sp. ASV99]|uniref:hypothetical protein n=1 Tax=Qipengyuania sp. ASV99 TaxID=3399681 RepID=UPI003A4C83CF
MIALTLALAAELGPVGANTVAPEEFRQKVAFLHVCITDVLPETGYRELGTLDVEKGNNAPTVRLFSNGPSHQFENGYITRVDTQKGDDIVVFYAHLTGERDGGPATLVIRDEHNAGRGTRVVTAKLEFDGGTREYQCDPTFRQQKQ